MTYGAIAHRSHDAVSPRIESSLNEPFLTTWDTNDRGRASRRNSDIELSVSAMAVTGSGQAFDSRHSSPCPKSSHARRQ
jgi:hypothetical protein